MVEASPDYFSSGARVALAIRSMLPNAKIIVLVRDPVERLISYYRSDIVYDNYANALLGGLDFSQFVDLALNAEKSTDLNDPQAIEC